MDYLTIYKSGKYKRRVGHLYHDGGYIIAELDGDYDGFISGGIEKDITFEVDILSLNPNLKCLAFDGTIDSLPQEHNRITFIKKNIDKKNSENTTDLIDYITGSNMFLKLDIEGYEYRVLPEIIKKGKLKCFKQMVIEFHTPEDIHKHLEWYGADIQNVSNDLMKSIITRINDTHALIHLHGNPVPGTHELEGVIIPNVFECTFIRNDFIQNKSKNVKPVPTPLDRPNIPGHKEIDLNYWPFVN